MKRFIMALVCLMTMVVSANAQDYKDVKYHKIKEAAVEAFKSNLIAPSKFILSDKNGNKISIDDLYVSVENEKVEIDTISYKWGIEWSIDINDADSVVVYERYYERCWVVLIYGDAMNRMGGYKQTTGLIYVYGTEDYPIAYSERRCKTKKIFSTPQINWETEHFSKHIKGIDIPFTFGKILDSTLLTFDGIKCPLCRNEWYDLGKDDYEKLVNTRRKCKEYKEYEKKKDQKRKQDEEDRKNKKEAKFNKYLNM